MCLSILIVDDEPAFRGFVCEALALEGYEVATAGSLAEAERYSAEHRPDVVLLDRCLPDGDGIDFLRLVDPNDASSSSVMVVTAYGNVANAVDALKLGATDYLQKPVSLGELVVKLRRLVDARSMRQDLLSKRGRSRHALSTLVAHSPSRREVVRQLHTLAESRTTPVLLAGPSGSGKQVVAEALHQLSYGHGGEAPLVEVNCATAQPDLLEAELFGRSCGDNPVPPAARGLLELANGGTVLLNEVGRLPQHLQLRLLSLFDHQRFRSVGRAREVSVALRVVATTSEEPTELVARGALREDFYHRLAVFVLSLAPLSACPEDIRPLCDHFLHRFATQLGKPVRHLAPQAAHLLQRYDYPGNVRELRNVIERAVILCPGDTIEVDHVVLPAQASPQRLTPSFFSLPKLSSGTPLPLEQVERLYVRQVLQHFRGHRTAAAESLGISYPTFLRRLRELGIGGVGRAAGS